MRTISVKWCLTLPEGQRVHPEEETFVELIHAPPHSSTVVAIYARSIWRTVKRAIDEQRQYFEDELAATQRLVDNLDDQLAIARRWNSATPVNSIERKYGGGYFLANNGKGMVIDPGFNYIDLLLEKLSLSVKDIDATLITHDHPDHCYDFEGLVTLLWALERRCGQRRRMRLFCNQNVLDKYRYLIRYNQPRLYSQVLSPRDQRNLSRDFGFTIYTIPTIHREICRRTDCGFGVIVERNDGFRLGITGDTAWNPVLVKDYANVDLLVAHLGNVEDTRSIGHHLGTEGIIRLLRGIRANDPTKPRLVVVTEFGEEVGNYRRQLINYIVSESNVKEVIPADADPLRIKIPSLEILCRGERWKPFSDVRVRYYEPQRLEYVDC